MLTRKINPHSSKPIYGFLHWSEESHIEQREINSFISLGRDKDNMVFLNDDFVSRRHCRIQKKENEGFVLLDMNSRNGTFLNGNRIFKAVLKNNDRIQIGKKEFTFSFERFEPHWNMHTRSKNETWKKQLDNIPNMAKSQMPVLIYGPSGTGKEMLAKLIHRYSQRSTGPMVSVNCSALSESLVESEFFGHIKGSYTGALTSRKGAFVAASGGSLFLDEIGDLPLNLQPKLLRAIEYQEIKPVGSDKTIKTDVRIIAATHQNLSLKIKQNTFRKDLYFRLHVLSVTPPALKDRMEDFEDLLNFFCAEYHTGFSSMALIMLKQYGWPGNIRELKNTVARAKALYPGGAITKEQIPSLMDMTPEMHTIQTGRSLATENLMRPKTPPPNAPAIKKTEVKETKETQVKQKQEIKDLEIFKNTVKDSQPEYKTRYFMKQVEKDILIRYLTLHNGNQRKICQALNIPRSTLCGRLKRHQLIPKDFQAIKP